jgi:predicted transcriptional regulator of viral defense system
MDRKQYQRDKLVELLASGQMIRLKELQREGISSATVANAERDGLIIKLSRGVYQIASANYADRQSFAEATVRVPYGVICLLSAAEFHGLTVQNPSSVHMAIPQGRHIPRVESPPLQPYYWSKPEFFDIGIETVDIAGTAVRITNPARTVIDMFRHFNMDKANRLEIFNAYFDQGHDAKLLREYARTFGDLPTEFSHYMTLRQHIENDGGMRMGR